MSETESKSWEKLHAYHDGELGGLARWRFERRLRRSPQLRRDLAALARIGELVCESEMRASEPDLWDRIEQRLPALDARRAFFGGAGGRDARIPWTVTHSAPTRTSR